jgi:hypothetical protein
VENYRESRRGMRFPVEARVVFKWVDETGNVREGEGRSRNISERGAFVIAKKYPPRGASLELKLFLPRIPITPTVVTVIMNATVVRSEERASGSQDESGFAVEGQSTQLAGLPEA